MVPCLWCWILPCNWVCSVRTGGPSKETIGIGGEVVDGEVDNGAILSCEAKENEFILVSHGTGFEDELFAVGTCKRQGKERLYQLVELVGKDSLGGES